MFKKTERLSQVEFSEFFKKGKKHHFSHLTIITLPYPSRKVAVVVGKKVVKSAARRNTIKRRVYASLRKFLVPANYKGVLIVMIKPSYITLSRRAADELFIQSIAQVVKSA